MNSIEAKYPTDIASPEAPTGLGIAGSETGLSPQELSQIAKNAENFALWFVVWNKVKDFADFKGQEGSRIRRNTLELVGGLALIASAACGDSDSKASTSVVDTATPTPIATGQTIGEIVTATVVSTPEVKAVPKVEPQAVKIITQESKQETIINADKNLTSINSGISSIERPPNARIAPEGLKQLQTNIDLDIAVSKAALAKGNVDEAREALIRVTQYIGNLQKSGNTVVIPKQMKDDHDPAGKYTKDRVVLDSGLFDYYFGVVDILVATDSSYPSGSK